MSNDANTENNIRISGLNVKIRRKPIKNLHLTVLPPDGKVRVSAPEHITNDAIRLAVVDKLAWIKRQKKDFAEQSRQTERQFVSGETHYAFGNAYRLNVANTDGNQTVKFLDQIAQY